MRVNVTKRSGPFLIVVFAAVIGAMTMISPRVSIAQTNGKTAPEVHMCSVLSEDDVAPLVGAHQLAQETKGGTTCMWGDPGVDPTKLRLLIQAPSFAQNSTDPLSGVNSAGRDKLESSFKANRKQAFDDKNSHAKDEPQLGKTAFSALTDDGVEIIIMKKNNLLNIRYLTGSRGTPENVDAIRKAAAKVAASF
jgi:hypothetical protein